MNLSGKINELEVGQGKIAVFYLAQAGFCIKSDDNKIIVIDAYLSDAAERLFGFKRMTPSMLIPDEIDADLYLSTHSHADHLDPDALPVITKNKKTFFIGSPDCEEVYKQNNLLSDRYKILKEGDEYERNGVTIRATFADHGDLAPDAVGLLIEIEGIKIYHAGDTSFSPEKIKASLNTEVDILIAPINGQYGNMDAGEACALAAIIKPKIVIASHFWMFLQHVCEGGKGDPTTFLKESAGLPNEITAMVMAPGEYLTFSKKEK